MAQGVVVSSSARVSAWSRLLALVHRAATLSNHAVDFLAAALPYFGGSGGSQISVNGLAVRCTRSIPSDKDLLEAWEQLYARVPDATPFQSPDWQRALLRAPQATRRLRFFTIWDGRQLIGVMPLEARRGSPIRSTGTILSDYLDPLIDPARRDACWGALIAAIHQLLPGRDIVLEHLRDEVSPRSLIETTATASQLALSDGEAASVARIALPDSWEAYLATLDSHERKELKRKLKKAEAAGGTLLVCKEPASICGELEAMFALAAETGGNKARKANWLFKPHFQACGPAMARAGRLELCKLMIEGRFAAGLIVLPSANGPILWNTAFDPAMKQWSPGIVLFAMLIRRAIEQKGTVVDLLRGQYDYKYRLGAKDYPLGNIELRQKSRT